MGYRKMTGRHNKFPKTPRGILIYTKDTSGGCTPRIPWLGKPALACRGADPTATETLALHADLDTEPPKFSAAEARRTKAMSTTPPSLPEPLIPPVPRASSPASSTIESQLPSPPATSNSHPPDESTPTTQTQSCLSYPGGLGREKAPADSGSLDQEDTGSHEFEFRMRAWDYEFPPLSRYPASILKQYEADGHIENLMLTFNPPPTSKATGLNGIDNHEKSVNRGINEYERTSGLPLRASLRSVLMDTGALNVISYFKSAPT
jgi:hypothetical protein